MAGRPRKAGKRHPNGRLVRQVTVTTPEIDARRRALAGRNGDPTKTSSPADLAEMHGIIDRDTAAACAWFAYSARVVLGAPENVLDNQPRPGDMGEAKYHRVTREYLAAIAGLTPVERSLLLDLLHFASFPPWLLSKIAGERAHGSHLAQQQTTLKALAKLARQHQAYMRGVRSVRPIAPMLVAAE